MSDGNMEDSDRRQSCCSGSDPLGVKIAGLWKRSQGLHRFTKPNYRHRIFILTKQCLSYYSGSLDKIGSVKGRIPVESIKAVELVDQTALGLANTLQVIYQSKKHGFVTLYITGRDTEECSDWVSSIRQACYFNHDMLMHYHPGAYTKTGWSCCQQRHKPTLGCQPTYYLLTRSSSRYAEMRRAQRISRRSNSRPYSTPHRSSDTTASHISERAEPLPKPEIRSTSCDNLHMVDHTYSLSHLASTPTSSSCYTLDVVSDATLSANGRATAEVQDAKRTFFQDENHALEEPDSRTKSLDSLTSSSDAKTTSQHRRLGSVDSGTEATPPPSTKKLLYVGGSRSSSISGGDPSFECHFHSWPRKTSIEPRISDSDPEVIHV